VTARSQTIVAAVGVALVLLLVFFLLIRPRRAELGRVRNEVQSERDRTQQLEAELARLEALRDDAPRLQARLDEMRALVPERNDVSVFISQVQTAAVQAGVGFVQITPELPKPPPEGAQLAEVRTTIGARGGYFAIQDFIRRLYDLERAVRIDGLTMTGTEDDQEAAEQGRITATFTARVFFELPEAAAPAAAPTPGTTTTTTTTTTAPAPAPAPVPAS
jgi:Tfp pilus assembly protein PilO